MKKYPLLEMRQDSYEQDLSDKVSLIDLTNNCLLDFWIIKTPEDIDLMYIDWRILGFNPPRRD